MIVEKWIKFSKLVKKDKNFHSCPVCGGKVMLRRFREPPLKVNVPECQNCGRWFNEHKKLHLFNGFKILAPTEYFKPATENV